MALSLLYTTVNAHYKKNGIILAVLQIFNSFVIAKLEYIYPCKTPSWKFDTNLKTF